MVLKLIPGRDVREAKARYERGRWVAENLAKRRVKPPAGGCYLVSPQDFKDFTYFAMRSRGVSKAVAEKSIPVEVTFEGISVRSGGEFDDQT